jgi:HEAT repeat protein/MFS family permease
MPTERTELNRLEILKALKVSNLEAIFSTVHVTLTGGAFQTGFALLLGANNVWMGILSSFPTFAGLSQILAAYFIERRGERRLFTAFFAGVGRLLWLPILLLPFIASPSVQFSSFVVLLLVSSVFLSASTPAFTSWMSDLVPPDQRGRYFGFRNMLAGITTMVVSLPAAWFLDLAAKRHLFPQTVAFAAIFGLAVICAAVGVFCLVRQAEPPMQRMESAPDGGLKSLLAFYRAPFVDANFRRLVAFSGSFAFAQFFAAPFYIVYALQELKLNYAWLQIFAAVASLTSLLGMPLWGYLSDKFGNRALLAIACSGTAITPLLWVYTSARLPLFTILLLIVNNMLGGFFWAGVGLTQFNLLISATPNERKSVYVGAYSAATGLAGGIAPIVGGALLTALGGVHVRTFGWVLGSYQLVFIINSVLRFVSLPLLGRVSDALPTTAREVLVQLGAGRVGAFVNIRRMQRAQNEEERREALQALRSARTALAVEELIAALDDPSLPVREEAAETLGEIGDTRAVEALVAHLDDAASGIVDECATALGRIGDPRAVGPLVRILLDGEKLDRAAAARALGRIGDASAAPALRRVLSKGDPSQSPEVMEACAGALGALADVDSVDVLAGLLDHAPRTLHIAAIRALGDIGDPRATEPLLKQLADEDDQAVIAYAAVALAMAGAEQAIPDLLDALDRVDSPVARKQILNSIGTLLGEGRTFYPLLAQEPYARDQAIERMLAEMGRREAPEDRPGTAGFGGRRRRRQLERALESYVEGDYAGALRAITRMAPKEGDPLAAHILEWADRTARRRSLLSEEFLLALFAARRILAA